MSCFFYSAYTQCSNSSIFDMPFEKGDFHKPNKLAYSHSRNLLFVSQLSSPNVLVYDTSVEPMSLTTKFFVGTPTFMVISRDGNRLFVTLQDTIAYDISNLTSVKKIWTLTQYTLRIDDGLDIDDDYLYGYTFVRVSLIHLSNGM